MASSSRDSLVLREGIDIVVLGEDDSGGVQVQIRPALWLRALSVLGVYWAFAALRGVISLILAGIGFAVTLLILFLAIHLTTFGPADQVPYKEYRGRFTRTSMTAIAHTRLYGDPDTCRPGCTAPHGY